MKKISSTDAIFPSVNTGAYSFLSVKKQMHIMLQSCSMAICAGKYSGRHLSDFLLPAMTVHCTFTIAASKNTQTDKLP